MDDAAELRDYVARKVCEEHALDVEHASRLNGRNVAELRDDARRLRRQLGLARGRCDAHRRKVNGYRWRQPVRAVVARDTGICWLCGQPGATSADHVRRWADGGTDDLNNLRAAHITCNKRRG